MAEEKKPTRTEIGALGEFGLIDRIQQKFPIRNESTSQHLFIENLISL